MDVFSPFMPHGMCFLWRPDIMLLHVLSDFVIALSYFSIPIAILYFIGRRKDLIRSQLTVGICSVLFIMLCGITHLFSIGVLWYPAYWLEGGVKAACAVISVITAIMAWFLIPKLLRIPTATQLQAVIDQKTLELREENQKLRESQEHIEVMMREMTHRSKNLLTVVQSIAKQTARSMAVGADFSEVFGDRLRSLSVAHDMIAKTEWRGSNIRDIISAQINHLIDERVTVIGPEILLVPEVAQYIALAMHELGTNSVKHGALSSPLGSVEISWMVTGPRIEIVWDERGGKDFVANRKGFGLTLLTRIVPQSLDGISTIDSNLGFKWTLDFPVEEKIIWPTAS